jgi:aminoglycoside 3-N-acetyltransferase
MNYRPPPSLRKLCREILPLFCRRADGGRALRLAAKILETDRWNSFDRFHQTTRTMTEAYRQAGARTEVYRVPTGGGIGTGRWVIHEACDIGGATAEVVAPVRRRLVDWRENPFHLTQWSAATAAAGVTGDLVIADTPEELARLPVQRTVGRILLTRMNPRWLVRELSVKEVAGVISDQAVRDHPEAVAWTKLGWGGVPLGNAAVRLVAMALSQNQGEELRQLLKEHRQLRVRLKVNVRRYAGSHDVVSGLVLGRSDPQTEVWAIAHAAEPGAVDNAGGMAVCVEMAAVLEGLIAAGKLRRPRRTIRLVNAYESYGFFHYLEKVNRLQAPLAGVCLDGVGCRAEFCDGRLFWHDTVSSSAGFVDRVGEAVLRETLKQTGHYYRLGLGTFIATLDTLVGDPRVGFPCPYITSAFGRKHRLYAAYHSSADDLKTLSKEGLAISAAAMAGYLYYLAEMGSEELVEVARAETDWTVRALATAKRPAKGAAEKKAAVLAQQHRQSIERLGCWMWAGERRKILAELAECDGAVRAAAGAGRAAKRLEPEAERVIPRRKRDLTLANDNTPPAVAELIGKSGLRAWDLYWADGQRSLAEIAALIEADRGEAVSVEQVRTFFEAHAAIGYVDLIPWKERVTKAQLIRDLRRLGLRAGMDVMVHSAMSKLGHVEGGAETVIDAILTVLGKKGTLLAPSFNHNAAKVFNPLATPTTSGAIAEALWRRAEAARSLHPTHAVAALGPGAESYCQGHLEAGVFGLESPIGRLVQRGGYLLSLGVTQLHGTTYHVAEFSLSCGCTDSFASWNYIVDTQGQVRRVPGLAWREGRCPVDIVPQLEETLVKRGLQRQGPVGRGEGRLVLARDLYDVRREHLKAVCPTCQVKPRIHRRRLAVRP